MQKKNNFNFTSFKLRQKASVFKFALFWMENMKEPTIMDNQNYTNANLKLVLRKK